MKPEIPIEGETLEFSKKSPVSLAVRYHKISTAAGEESVCRNVNPVKIVRLDEIITRAKLKFNRNRAPSKRVKL